MTWVFALKPSSSVEDFYFSKYSKYINITTTRESDIKENIKGL